MFLPPLNPIKAAIAGFAFGAGVSMIVFGAVKGALDIINEAAAEAEKRAQDSAAEPATAFVDDPDDPVSDDDYVI